MDPYRTEAWLQFRAAVMQADEHACSRCGRDAHDGIKLHVHHRRYLPHRQPWEYPLDLCETLCAGCHAAEHGHTPPRDGWTLVDVHDHEEVDGECELCGTAIRYVFTIANARWISMEVGSDCCDKLTGNREATEIERERKGRAARRRTFVSSNRWIDSGQAHYINHKNIDVRVSGRAPRYRLSIGGVDGLKFYVTLELAKLAAFDTIESGWVERHRQKRYRT